MAINRTIEVQSSCLNNKSLLGVLVSCLSADRRVKNNSLFDEARRKNGSITIAT